MSQDAEVNVSFNWVTVSDPVIRIEVHGIGGLAPGIGGLAPRTFQSFVDVEADQTAVECWLRENAMPLGWNEELAERKAEQSKKRSQPRRNKAKQLLRKMFPGTIPSKDELPDKDLRAQCKGVEWNGISDDTIARAAAELRDGQ